MSIVSVYSINDAQIRAQFGKERIVADPQMGPNERFGDILDLPIQILYCDCLADKGLGPKL